MNFFFYNLTYYSINPSHKRRYWPLQTYETPTSNKVNLIAKAPVGNIRIKHQTAGAPCFLNVYMHTSNENNTIGVNFKQPVESQQTAEHVITRSHGENMVCTFTKLTLCKLC